MKFYSTLKYKQLMNYFMKILPTNTTIISVFFKQNLCRTNQKDIEIKINLIVENLKVFYN